MSSRARGISPARRLCAARRMTRAETGHCRKSAILTFGIPDKMAVRTVARSPPRSVNSGEDRFEGRLPALRHSSKPLATASHLRQERCFGVCQVPSLRPDADDTPDGTSPLHDSAGETTGFLAAPLLLCTATSRGKDDDYRGLFADGSGEIFFWWSRFWTEAMENEIDCLSKC